MKLNQVLTRSSIAAIALLNISLATNALAESIVVTRGPNGAAHVVKTDNVPADAKVLSNNGTGLSSKSQRNNVGGAEPQKTSQLIQRGPNGAFFPARK